MKVHRGSLSDTSSIDSSQTTALIPLRPLSSEERETFRSIWINGSLRICIVKGDLRD